MAKRRHRRKSGPQKKATTSQLRADIDRGKTVDKVDVADPSAAALGTDDEAAGRPPGDRAVADARRKERSGGDEILAARKQRKRRRVMRAVSLAALPLLALLALTLWLLYGRP